MASGTYKHPHEIAARLQREVDLILLNVNDKVLYAEFRDDEIIDIQDGITHQRMRETIDERIQFNMKRRPQHEPLMQKSVRHTQTAHKGLMKFIYWLFKPFHL
jgi:hypothetical protein